MKNVKLKSRTQNIFTNSFVGIFTFVLQFLIVFVSRIIFIRYLNIDFLGINDLYSNIITILSLADLGMETVLMYSLYKPIVKKDYLAIAALITTFKKIYYAIAAAIFGLGICLVPFLKYIIHHSTLNSSELVIYYLFFLINTVCSYLFTYTSSLFQADQKVYVVKLIRIFTRIICSIFQILALILFRSYILYLIIMVMATIMNNLILFFKARKEYSFLKFEKKQSLEKNIKLDLIQNIKSMFLYKIGATIVNSTDNIFISCILGASMVGYYSNYYTVISALNSIIGIFNSSFIPGIGNFLHADVEKKKKQNLFFSMLFFYFIIATVFSSLFILCINQFISLWVGKEYLLAKNDTMIIALAFYFQCIAHPMWIFRETGGLFKEIKFCILCMAILNILFSYVGGKEFGLFGIIAATIISRILTLFWYEPKILCKKLFEIDSNKYWEKWIKYFTVSLFSLFIIYYLFYDRFFTFLGLVAKSLASVSIIFSLFLIFFIKSLEVKYLLEKMKQIKVLCFKKNNN